MSAVDRVHLWEVEHPYYGAEATRGGHQEFDSWVEFANKMSNLDPDMNLVYRWDWDVTEPDENGETWGAVAAHCLTIFWVQQRRSAFMTSRIRVTPADEDSVRAWLGYRLAYISMMWAPLSGIELAAAHAIGEVVRWAQIYADGRSRRAEREAAAVPGGSPEDAL